jgi:hypothetical protein
MKWIRYFVRIAGMTFLCTFCGILFDTIEELPFFVEQPLTEAFTTFLTFIRYFYS